MDGEEQPVDAQAQEPGLTTHELRELKKQQKLEQRQQQSVQAQDTNKQRRTKTYVITGALALLAAVALWFWAGRGITDAVVAVDIADHPVMGAPDAAVQLVVFGDFQCPFTRRFWQGAFPKIVDAYGSRLKISFWPVPTAKHNYDRASAMAAYCAHEQGKFWEYAKALFDRQGAATDGNLMDYARELALDTDAFWQCYSSNKYKDKVQEDYEQGRAFGVVQTPTVAITGMPLLSGDLSFDDYKTFIDLTLQS